MVGITERNKIKAELTGLGYSMKYIDEWIPKTTLHRHKPSYYVTGEVAEDVGSTVKGVPGNPDYVLRKAKIGLFPWAPGESCECQWCVAGRGEEVEEPVIVEVKDSRTQAAKGTFNKTLGWAIVDCPVCEYVAEGASLAGARSRLRAHSKGH